MKILELRSQNVKRLSAVSITPDGNMIVVGGRNGQGKSSLLDSIMYALAGKATIPAKPLRKGQTEGLIRIKLDAAPECGHHHALTVERKFFEGGKTELEITTDDGYLAPSPQTILNDLCGRIAFDPLEFTRLKADKQVEQLRELVGLDFADLNYVRKVKYDERADINRDGVRAKARLDSMKRYPDAPAVESSVAELVTEQKARERKNLENTQARKQLEKMQRDVDTVAAECDELDRQIAELMQRLEVKRGEQMRLQDAIAEQSAVVGTLVDADLDEIRNQIVAAGELNAQVRANAERAQAEAALAELRQQSQALSDEIKAIDAQKQAQLTAAKWPVSGLGFDDDGITLNGLPFEQASSAEQLRVSVAMGAALNPTLRVMLIRDGSLLDEDSLALVAELAEQHNTQVWIERVGESGPCSVIIEDGHVKGEVPEPVAVGA